MESIEEESQRLLEIALDAGAAGDLLDEMVHEAAQEEELPALNAIEDPTEQEEFIAYVERFASAVNNSGHKAQIRYLLEQQAVAVGDLEKILRGT